MQIQINTDESVEGNARLAAHIRTDIESRLARFARHITRIEVHLSDVNATKTGGDDQRCVLEARLEGRKPEAVTEHSATLQQAYTGATKKMQAVLESTLGRLNHVKGSASIRTLEIDEAPPS